MFRAARGTALASVIGAGLLVITGGIAAYTPRAAAAQATRTDLGYTCSFPAGNFAVSVTITATYPASVPVGPPAAPIGVRISSLVPKAALAGSVFARPGTVIAGSTDVLTVIETRRSAAQPLHWQASGSRARPTAGGLLALTASGSSGPLPASEPATITFTASSLAISLRSRGATLNADCVPGNGAGARLATIKVSQASPSASPTPGQGQRTASKTKFPQGCGKIKVTGDGVATCAYLTGYADVTKLIGAALLQPRRPAKPGLVNVDIGQRHAFKKGKLVEYSTGQLYYKGRPELPPVTATFLAFRFVPVTATLHITELSFIDIVSVSGVIAPPYPITVDATTRISIRVSGVRVNGRPLDVGTGCRTASPVTLKLVGKGKNLLPPVGYTLPTGGPLLGKVTIPAFTDCGVTENLDPLLTGSISGQGNFVKMTQGELCGPSQPQNWVCPPPIPKPKR